MSKVIGIIAGGLRKDSYSKKLGKAVLSIAPQDFNFKIINLEDLPIYNQDFDDNGKVPEA
jgi:chromate reductase